MRKLLQSHFLKAGLLLGLGSHLVHGLQHIGMVLGGGGGPKPLHMAPRDPSTRPFYPIRQDQPRVPASWNGGAGLPPGAIPR